MGNKNILKPYVLQVHSEKSLKSSFYWSTFVYSRFPLKIQFFNCLHSSVAPCGDPMIDTEGRIFEI